MDLRPCLVNGWTIITKLKRKCYIIQKLFTSSTKEGINNALFNSPQNPKVFQNFPLHRILKHMYRVLDIDKNN